MATLYATHGGSGTTDTNLYTVDPATGALTAVGDTGHIFTGLAFDPTDGTLYGVTGNLGANQQTLFTIDPATGTATSVGALGSTVADICFDNTGQMYGWNPSARKLTLIDKTTGIRTDAGASGLSSNAGCGLSFLAGTLYLSPQSIAGDLFTVDTTTGHATDVGVMTLSGGGDNVGALTESGGVLWGIGDRTGRLFTIGAINGAGEFPLTFVSTLDNTEWWDSLAWSLGGGGGGGGGGTGAQPEGVSIAFNDPTLEPAPTWTRIDA